MRAHARRAWGCAGGLAALAGASLAGVACAGASGEARPTSTVDVLDGAVADAAPAPTGAEMARLIGRVDRSDPAGPRLAWPGSAIELHFRGTGLDVRLHDTAVDQLGVVIDGKPPVVVKTTTTEDAYVIARSLPDAEHTVTLTKRTETFFGTVQLLGVTALAGADGGAPGTLLAPPAARARRMEVVGDSITCGYGDLGVGPTCTFSPDTENEASAYGAVAAARLGADHVAIAWSGKGMLRNYDGLTTDVMPTLWTRALGDDAASAWDFSWSPDVVVVNLGTNDFAKGDPGQPFEAAYAAFVATLRAHYPAAFVVCATSPLLSTAARDAQRAYIRSVVDAAHASGDAKVSLLDFDEQLPSDGYGCDYHPSGVTHAKMSDKLVAHVHALTGW
jgi:lysophospholipase L1-like esterase